MKLKPVLLVLMLSLGINAHANTSGGEIDYASSQPADYANSMPPQYPSGAYPQDNLGQPQTAPSGAFVAKETVQRQQLTDEERAAVTQPVDYQSFGESDREVILRMLENGVKPSQITKQRANVRALENAAYSPDPQKCMPKEIHASSSPNAPLPLLRLGNNGFANVTIIDQMGNPYRIYEIIGNSNLNMLFNENNPQESTFYVGSKYKYGAGNFSVKLYKNPIPLVFEYTTNQSVADCSVIVRMDTLSPDANIESRSYQGDINTADKSLYSVLYGMQPKGSKPLKTSAGASAWLTADNKVILRTKYQLISPEPYEYIHHADGTYIYKVRKASVYMYQYNDMVGEIEVSR